MSNKSNDLGGIFQVSEVVFHNITVIVIVLCLFCVHKLLHN